MFGIAYLAVCLLFGYTVTTLAAPKLADSLTVTFRGNALKASKLFILVPAYFVSGTLAVTWVTYIAANVLRDYGDPLRYANLISIPLFTVLSAVGIFLICKKKNYPGLKGQLKAFTAPEIVFLFVFALIGFTLMWKTLYMTHDRIYVGLSAFGGLSPKLGMIRSFSFGDNFPTQFLHFAGESSNYPFMFDFLAGNLEYLGLRLDLALNIPSYISFICCLSAIYCLALKLSGKRVVGLLSVLFFTFRSSESLFRFLADLPEGTGFLDALTGNSEFLGVTQSESQGLYNLNLYASERQYAFVLTVMLIVLILFLPNLYHMEHRILSAFADKDKGKKGFKKAGQFLKLCFADKEGWKVSDVRKSLFAGIMLGAVTYFDGKVLIAAVLILAALFLGSDRRSEFIITLTITGVLAIAQNFVLASTELPYLELAPGYLAENKSFFGLSDFVLKLFGIMPLIVLIVFVISKALRRYMIFSFSLPAVFAFVFTVGPDTTGNSRIIMTSAMLLVIFVAIFLCSLFENRNVCVKILVIVLALTLCSTGVYDYCMFLKKNAARLSLSYDEKSELTLWVKENTSAKDLFLTPAYSVNPVVLGGGMLYLGWPYYGWSQGYDTDKRYENVKLMYASTDAEFLKKMLRTEGIDYVIIDYTARTTEELHLNEQIFEDTFEPVFETGSGEWKTTVYKVS